MRQEQTAIPTIDERSILSFRIFPNLYITILDGGQSHPFFFSSLW